MMRHLRNIFNLGIKELRSLLGDKAMLTLMLQAMGQADAGRVIIKMEKQISQMEDEAQAAVFSSTVKQIKQAYRQCRYGSIAVIEPDR
jgi:hypothetical protein